jgi:hypothetical protein
MARRVFYSFHYQPDCGRAAQVRNMGVIEGNKPASDNDWEKIKAGGDAAIQRWIDGQLEGKSCNVVLIGAGTAGRKWINYEIKKAWDSGKALLGVYIHRLKDFNGNQSAKGANPFSGFRVGNEDLANIVTAHDPFYFDSKDVYAYISANLTNWIEEAIKVRSRY